MNIRNLGELAALATAFCWSMSGISFEKAGKKVGSLSVNYIRLILAFFFVSLYSLIKRGLLLPIDASMHNWIFLTISGLIGFTLGDLFLFQAYVEVGTRISMLIMASSPPLTALLGFIFLGERLDLKSLVGMAITITGIAIVILGKDEGEKKFKFNYSKKGLISAFLGSFGQAIGLIISKIGMKNYNALASTQIRIIAGFIGFTILIAILKKFNDIKTAFKDKGAMKDITIGAFFGPFVGVTLSLVSLQYTASGISSTITSITPVTIIPFSVILLKERVKPKEILGAVLSVIGVAVLFL
ncbi:MAG: DMT family transporter [Tissierellia bacterium]|nr:DMT family transporter [Tissierellia bacterium]